MVSGAVLAGTDELREVVDGFAAIDVSSWPDAAISDTYVDLRREIDRLECVAARLLVAVADRGVPYTSGATSVAAWSQWHTGQRAVEAKASFDAGVACETLPLTSKAWEQGEISASLARSICRGRCDGHEEVYADIEDVLVHYAAERNVRDLDGLIGYYRNCCDQADDREPSDKNGFYLSHVNGRWIANGDLDALGGQYLKDALDAATDAPTEGDERSPAKRRADALVRIARFFLDHEDLPVEGGEAPHVALTVQLETILDWLPIPAIPHDPAGLAAHISDAQRDQVLCDCNLTRIVLGPKGQILDIGREMRIAPRYLRRAVAHRDRGCRYPGCDRAANRCEVHHVTPWCAGGNTALDNLVLLCPFHHHVVHRQGWTNTFDGITYTVNNDQTWRPVTPARGRGSP